MAVSVQRPGLPTEAVAGDVVVTPRIYWDETRTRLLAEGHPEARFLAYAQGTVVPARLVAEMGLTEFVAKVPVEPAPEQGPDEPAGPDVVEKSRRRVRRADRQLAPGVVADTSIDGEANVLISEPGSPLRNGVDK